MRIKDLCALNYYVLNLVDLLQLYLTTFCTKSRMAGRTATALAGVQGGTVERGGDLLGILDHAH